MWFFKKRQNKLDEIEKKLTASFGHIRNDISFLFEKINEQEKEMKSIKETLSATEIIASAHESPSSKIIIQNENEDYSLKNTYETLTNIHKALLIKLGLLLKETPGSWIPMRVLTSEIYPQKEYEKVKSMISNYTDNLLNLGFIQKKRIGRQIVLALTDKGFECLPEAVRQKKRIAQNE